MKEFVDKIGYAFNELKRDIRNEPSFFLSVACLLSICIIVLIALAAVISTCVLAFIVIVSAFPYVITSWIFWTMVIVVSMCCFAVKTIKEEPQHDTE